MKIKIGHYVTTVSGEMFEVVKLSVKSAYLRNLVTGNKSTWPKNLLKPLFIQVGDEFVVKYWDGVEKLFKLIMITWNVADDTYFYTTKGDGIDEVFTEEQLADFIERFL